jgi:hypothetical protein
MSIKCRALSGCQDLLRVDNIQLIQSQVQLSGTADHTIPVVKQHAHPVDIIIRVEAWQDGADGNPVSDNEGNSPINWDGPDIIPSTAPPDRLLSFLVKCAVAFLESVQDMNQSQDR